ncbi:MAG: hypothetical protein HQL21_00630 [Candidatus Omnitrophica bacterium]|nr:hypothetical protein [Candidatus Omnitrophota bacterium]
MRKIGLICLWVLLVPFMGCVTTPKAGDADASYAKVSDEPEWIRNGEPVEFEGEMWYPTDELENLLSSEVYLMGEFRGVRFFIDRADVKPLVRLYTYFGKNRYRAFEKRRQ